MSEEKKTCPGCPRHCDLAEPHCGRGEEYARTGKLPEGGGHGPQGRLQFERREQQMVMKYLHHAVGIADRGGIGQERAQEMFSVITEEETAQLAELLERLSEHWKTLSAGQPSRRD